MTMHPTPSQRPRRGLTVVEVLFALSIILVGLIGIAAMVPFAARQANESYATVQSVVAGDSAVAMAESQAIFKPTFEKPWQVIDDELPSIGDSNKTYFYSFTDLYNNNGRKRVQVITDPKYQFDLLTRNLQFPLPPFDSLGTVQQMQHRAWIASNRTLGSSFYLDPTFWAAQDLGGKVFKSDWMPFRRSRFPYYAEEFGPRSPRPLRISLRDSNHLLENGGWMKRPAAHLTITPGGDVVPIKGGASTKSNSISQDTEDLPMRRQVLLTTDPATPLDPNSALPIQSVVSPNSPIWSALITPSESTPIIEKSLLPSVQLNPTTSDYRNAMRKYVLPISVETYDISIVVQRKRLLREIYANSGQTPVSVEGERVFGVTWDISLDEPSQSGTFEITLLQPSEITLPMEARIKAGDWLLLSRNVVHFYRGNAGVAAFEILREKHKWYRVVSAPSADLFIWNPTSSRHELSLRVSGAAWTWTTDELVSHARVGYPQPLGSVADSSKNFYQVTSATVIPNVVHVFERTMSGGN